MRNMYYKVNMSSTRALSHAKLFIFTRRGQLPSRLNHPFSVLQVCLPANQVKHVGSKEVKDDIKVQKKLGTIMSIMMSVHLPPNAAMDMPQMYHRSFCRTGSVVV